MFTRINFTQIISSHFKTLRSLNQNGKGIYIPDLITFFLLPLSLSCYLTVKNIDLSFQVSNLIAAISILGGFLFNLLAIIYSAMDKLKLDAEKNELKKIFIKEIHINISYCILLSILTTFFLIIYSYDFPCNFICYVLKRLILFINYFLLFQFFLTLLMVLNRVYILLKKDAGDI
jgi:hypothetical protein